MSSPLKEPHIIKMENLMRKIHREDPEIYKKITDVLDEDENPESIQQIKGVLKGTKYESKYNDLVENVDPLIDVTDSEIEDIIKNDARGYGENTFFYDKNNRNQVELIKGTPSKSAKQDSKKEIKKNIEKISKKPKKKEEEKKEEEEEQKLFGDELDFELKGGRRRKSRKNNKSKKSRKSRKQRK